MRGRSKLVAALALVLIGFSLFADKALADSWAPPRVQTIVSADGRARFTITPRAVESSLSYFEDRVRGREPAGQSSSGRRQPLGRLEMRGADRRWRTVWERPLVNDVSPASAVVSNDGAHVVTFDNWYSHGLGDNVVVIYDASGNPIQSLRLDGVVPGYMIDAFGRSVSSLYWQGEGTRIDGSRLRLAIVEPGAEFPSSARGFFVDVDLATGTVAPIADADLMRWRPRACEAHRRAVAELQQFLDRQRASLVAPASTDPQAWERYGYEVAGRLYWPNIPLVIELPEVQNELYSMNLTSFRTFLARPAEDEADRRVFVAVRQERLVAEVEQAAARLRPGGLAGVEMTFVADAAHWPRIAAALSASGARLRQVDPAVPLPHQPDYLGELPPSRTVDSACAA